MRIICEKGAFDLPPGLSIEMTNFNPVFSEQGEQSAPITLPASHRNLSLVGFSNRIDNYYKPLSEMKVDVVDDVFMRPGRMALHHANEQEISCTIYFNEGSFYSMIDDKSMMDVPLDVIEGVGSTHAEKVAYLITMLKNEYHNRTSEVFSVFPVATGTSVTRRITPFYREDYKDETFDFVLNGFESNIDFLAAAVNGDLTLNKFMAESSHTFIESGMQIPTDQGYGMTAFVNIFYFIQKMFTHLGYTFDDSLLRDNFSDNQWRIVMLNNVADAIYDAKLDLNQLVPDLSLKDFLKKIAGYFCGVFYINEFTKTVHFYLYPDFFKYRPALDLTKYMSSSLHLDAPAFKTYEILDSSDTEPIKKTSEPISFYLPKKTTSRMPYNAITFAEMIGEEKITYSGKNAWLIPTSIDFDFMRIDAITHRNSTVQLNDESSSEKKTESNKELILCGFLVDESDFVEKTLQFGSLDDIRAVRFKYKTASDRLFFANKSTIDFLKEKYAPYIDFYKNSNMEISCEVHLPPEILYNLDLSKQYLFDGTLFFIDKIEYALPYDGKQKLTLRPFRAYADR